MKRTSLLIAASCFIGLLTASIYASRIQSLRDEIDRSTEKVPVLAVTRDIRAGESIRTGDLTSLRVIKEQVSGRSISPENMELVLGRQTIHPIPEFDPILWTDFPEGPRVRYPSEKIPSGYRMIALPADEIHTLSHFIKPGDKVDIASSTYDDSKGRLVSRLIAKNIEVLAVGNLVDGGTTKTSDEEFPVSVSILVEPESALTILRASQSGEIHFLAMGSMNYPGKYNLTGSSASTADLTRARP